MIDMHSHILPRVDDGAPTLDVALAMLDELDTLGFRTVVATPHLTGPLTPRYEEAVQASFDALRPHAKERGIELLRGFEVRLSPDLPARLRSGEPITLAASNAVLVDLAPGAWPRDIDDALYNIHASGFRPVLAHPERHAAIQRRPGIGLALAETGAVLQVTFGSYAGVFGRRAKRAAEALLREGAVHLVATDAHSAGRRLASVAPGRHQLDRLVGKGGRRRLTVDNPRLALQPDAHIAPVAASGTGSASIPGTLAAIKKRLF